MRDVGFYLQDPVLAVGGDRDEVACAAFTTRCYAIESWMGGVEPLDLLFRAAWFFRLTGIGAVGFLAVTVFRSRWIGSVAMVGVRV